MNILYFNGLGDGHTRRRETWAINYLQRHGHSVTHGHVNWYERGRDFDSLLEEKEKQARKLSLSGRLAIVGSSAGVSLAFNVFGALPNVSRDFAIGLCGRIRPGDLPWWDHRTLPRMAHMGQPNQSPLFVASVTQCETALEHMQPGRLSRMRTVTQLTDFVVPKSTMIDERVARIPVPGIGHGMGIAIGVMMLPRILQDLTGGNE